MSKYASVDEAVKWVGEFYKALPNYHNKRYPYKGHTFAKEALLIVEKWSDISKKLDEELTCKIDGKIQKNSGTFRRIRNFSKPENNVYGIDLSETITEIISEFGLILRNANCIFGGTVSHNYFKGVDGKGVLPEYKSKVEYNFRPKDNRHMKQITSQTKNSR